MKVKLETREHSGVSQIEFNRDDELTSTNVLVNLDDGTEVIRLEIWQNPYMPKDEPRVRFLCTIEIINSTLNVRLASNARGRTKSQAIAQAFKNIKITFDPPLVVSEEQNHRYPKKKEVLESIAQELGVTRHTIVASGSDPL